VRVLHLTDPHLFGNADGELRGTNTLASLQAVVAHFLRSNWRADLIAVTGDIIQDDSRRAYERFRDCFSELDIPVACIPGNHDIPGMMQEVLDGYPFSFCGAHDLQNWLVVGIDSCVAGQAGGRVAREEIERLETLVSASSQAHVLVCLHHPPAIMGSRWLDSVGLEDSEDVLRQLARIPRVRATLSGHVHQAFSADIEGVQVIATPSTCGQFKPKSDLFAVDDRPPGYRLLELAVDGSIRSTLVWLDG
jgi:Icc protein